MTDEPLNELNQSELLNKTRGYRVGDVRGNECKPTDSAKTPNQPARSVFWSTIFAAGSASGVSGYLNKSLISPSAS